MSILNLNGPAGLQPKNRKSLRIWMGLGMLIAVLGVGSTLASTITINNGNNVEFGQGVQRTVYCGGNQTINLIPVSGFLNSQDDISEHGTAPNSAPGTFYLSGIRVTNIPSACSGKDFVFSAYNNSSDEPVAIATLTGDGTSLKFANVYWRDTRGSSDNKYGGILSLSKDSYVPATGLANLYNLDGESSSLGAFIIKINSNTTHAPIDSISRIVVETQDDTFGADEYTNGTSLSSNLSE